MSTCGIPDDFAKGASVYETAFKTMTGAMTANAGASLPFASPALFMAGPAFGLAMAAQYWGTVIGTLHGAAAAAGRLPAMDAPLKAPVLFWKADDEDSDAFAVAVANPMSMFAAATKTVYADMEHAAKDIVEVGEHFIAGVAEDADAVARAMEGAGAPAAKADAGEETGGTIMPEDFVRPAAIERPAEPDDLKQIAGIGPKLEQRLNGLGVWTYAQIADWTPEQVAWVDDYLSFKGRIGRDGWIAQAAALAGRRSDGQPVGQSGE
ncbi:NADH-ubiquinone dehydrogenase [Zhengella sp. ZM62]|uniref:NADH-ubiquinone dehydrogenase n=1 Tax=Zhengella sedimenti TaxID=3390035 RepID=UPI003975D9F8